MKRNSVFCAIILFLLFIPNVVRAEDTIAPASGKEPPVSFRELASRLLVETKDPFGFRPGSLLTEKGLEDGLPEFFDLRKVDTDGDGAADKSYVTPIKLQNPFGSCWGFAAIAGAETSILSAGLAADLHLTSNELDLSEKHLVYFVNRPVREEDDPSQEGEGYYNYEVQSSSDLYDTGGNTFFATSVFASGIGPVLENLDESFEYHGKNKKKEFAKVDKEEAEPFCYSKEDDWAIDDDQRFVKSFTLSGSIILPSPKYYAETSEEKKAANKAIKEQLLAGRAVQVSFYSDHSKPSDENPPEYINLENWAHYTFEPVDANHSVLIIGWDDRYPRENFAHEVLDENGDRKQSPIPDSDGAWLVKNSWGSKENEFPNRSRINEWGLRKGQDTGVFNETTGKFEYEPADDNAVYTGYFWMSYEDKSLTMPEVTWFEHTPAADEFRLMQYDYLPVQTVNAATADDTLKMANVFTAEEDSLLEYVSCQTTFPGTEVLYEIYRLNDRSDSPEQGKLVAQVSEVYRWGGFHKIKLENAPFFRKGERFSVVVTQLCADNIYSFSVQYSASEKYREYLPDFPFYAKAIVNRGESWFFTGGSWFDLSVIRDDLLYLLFYNIVEKISTGEYYTMDNFPIKAWLRESERDRRRERPGIPDFFRLEGELPATGITGRAGRLLSEKPASVEYSPLGLELQIPSLGITSEIVTLTQENGRYPVEWLGGQTGWLEGSARPSEGISVLAAHNTLNAEEYGPFALIGTLQEGDRFFLHRDDGRLMMFEVYANQKIGSRDAEALEKAALEYENTLTLLTCEDELPEGGYASRRIVSARKLAEQ